MRGLTSLLAALGAASAVAMPALPASGGGPDYGPNTCLNGFVWREAWDGDLVCVTPDVRAQARQDNALAASRRSPNGGPFGPDTCLQGFVWREARATDHVCVTPAERERARIDNQLAATRRNELRLTVTRTSRYQLMTDRINVGTAVVLLRPTAGRSRSWRVEVNPHPSAPGGLLSFRPPIRACRGATNAYFRVQDPTSTRWSSPRRVCAVL